MQVLLRASLLNCILKKPDIGFQSVLCRPLICRSIGLYIKLLQCMKSKWPCNLMLSSSQFYYNTIFPSFIWFPLCHFILFFTLLVLPLSKKLKDLWTLLSQVNKGNKKAFRKRKDLVTCAGRQWCMCCHCTICFIAFDGMPAVSFHLWKILSWTYFSIYCSRFCDSREI